MNDYQKNNFVKYLIKHVTNYHSDYMTDDWALENIFKIKYCELCGKSLTIEDTCQPCNRDSKLDQILE